MLLKMLPLRMLASDFTRGDGLVIDGRLDRPTGALRLFLRVCTSRGGVGPSRTAAAPLQRASRSGGARRDACAERRARTHTHALLS